VPARSYLHACGRLRFAFASSYHEARLADPIEHIVDELDRLRAGGVDAHLAEETIHQYDRAAQELWKAAGLAASSKNRDCRDDACTTSRKRADPGLVGARPGEPLSLPRTVQAPAGSVRVSQVRLGEIRNEDALRC
jgi:hypothetical protein